jgi:hypothetical protein
MSALRDDVVLACHAPVMRQRPHHQVPGIQTVRGLALRAEIFRRIKLRLDGSDDGFGDFVLHGEHVRQFAIVLFRPEMTAGRDVIELSCDTYTVAASANAALQDITDAEFGPDLLHVDRLSLVGKRRVARDYKEPAKLGQRGDDVLADPVGKIFLL